LKTQDFAAVIHAAAVSDYSIKGGASASKNDSSNEMTLELTKNPKLLDSIRGWSKNAAIKVVAFKLTATADLIDRNTRLEKLMKTSRPDFVVANDRSELPAWTFHKRDSGVIRSGTAREELGFVIEGALSSAIEITNGESK
jgi:phosphopantothenoylcysteine synthetase/decarboxylase